MTVAPSGVTPAPRPDPPGLADRVAEAVLAVPGVAALHAGRYGEAATHLPGRRVNGVQVREDRLEVHVSLEWGAEVLATADAVRDRCAGLAARRVDVVVEDVVGPPWTGDPGRP